MEEVQVIARGSHHTLHQQPDDAGEKENIMSISRKRVVFHWQTDEWPIPTIHNKFKLLNMMNPSNIQPQANFSESIQIFLNKTYIDFNMYFISSVNTADLKKYYNNNNFITISCLFGRGRFMDLKYDVPEQFFKKLSISLKWPRGQKYVGIFAIYNDHGGNCDTFDIQYHPTQNAYVIRRYGTSHGIEFFLSAVRGLYNFMMDKYALKPLHINRIEYVQNVINVIQMTNTQNLGLLTMIQTLQIPIILEPTPGTEEFITGHIMQGTCISTEESKFKMMALSPFATSPNVGNATETEERVPGASQQVQDHDTVSSSNFANGSSSVEVVENAARRTARTAVPVTEDNRSVCHPTKDYDEYMHISIGDKTFVRPKHDCWMLHGLDYFRHMTSNNRQRGVKRRDAVPELCSVRIGCLTELEYVYCYPVTVLCAEMKQFKDLTLEHNCPVGFPPIALSILSILGRPNLPEISTETFNTIYCGSNYTIIREKLNQEYSKPFNKMLNELRKTFPTFFKDLSYYGLTLQEIHPILVNIRKFITPLLNSHDKFYDYLRDNFRYLSQFFPSPVCDEVVLICSFLLDISETL